MINRYKIKRILICSVLLLSILICGCSVDFPSPPLQNSGEAATDCAHSAEPASYQEERYCSICGALVFDRLVADMEAKGIVCNAQLGVPYTFSTTSYKNRELKTEAEICFESMETVKSYQGRECEEGYNWLVLSLVCKFGDKTAEEFGWNISARIEDYYNIRLHDESLVKTEFVSTPEFYEEWAEYKILFYGEEMTARHYYKTEDSDWTKTSDGTYSSSRRYTFAVCVPEGYDGAVFGVFDPAVAIDKKAGWGIDELYNDESFLLFRMG